LQPEGGKTPFSLDYLWQKGIILLAFGWGQKVNKKMKKKDKRDEK
jgi:hypothetical protein